MPCSLVRASLSGMLRDSGFWLCVCRDPGVASSPGFLVDFSQQISFGASMLAPGHAERSLNAAGTEHLQLRHQDL